MISMPAGWKYQSEGVRVDCNKGPNQKAGRLLSLFRELYDYSELMADDTAEGNWWFEFLVLWHRFVVLWLTLIYSLGFV